jgi:hypothetical protein
MMMMMMIRRRSGRTGLEGFGQPGSPARMMIVEIGVGLGALRCLPLLISLVRMRTEPGWGKAVVAGCGHTITRQHQHRHLKELMGNVSKPWRRDRSNFRLPLSPISQISLHRLSKAVLEVKPTRHISPGKIHSASKPHLDLAGELALLLRRQVLEEEPDRHRQHKTPG